MNLWPIPSSPVSPAERPARNRLDVTLAEPAMPGSVEASRPSQAVPQVGSIQGVLTSAETQAIAALFGSAKNVYAPNGAYQQQAIPGLRLDLQA